LLVGFWNVFGDEDKTFELRDSLKPPTQNPKAPITNTKSPSFGLMSSQGASGVGNPPRIEVSTYKTEVTDKRKRSIPEIPDEFGDSSTPIHDVSNRIPTTGTLPQNG
jgi:hypothetical protein